MTHTIFRQKSLERLSSPEQLDQALRITGPLHWLGLVAAVAVIALGLCWGIWGEIPATVQGRGILIKPGAIREVVSPGAGQVEKCRVAVDDEVRPGQVMAELALPELAFQIREARSRLARLEAEQELIGVLQRKTLRSRTELLHDRRQTLENAIHRRQSRLADLARETAGQEAPLGNDASATGRLPAARETYERTLAALKADQQERMDITDRETALTAHLEKERFDVAQKISAAKERIELLEQQQARQSLIFSPHRGRILEVFIKPGQPVKSGDAVASLEVIRDNPEPLTGVLYFPPGAGKQIRTGMPVRIAPSVAQPEAYGYLLATAGQVSGFPATRKGMLQVLQNRELVENLSAGGAPIAVLAALLPDRDTISGYQWSSGAGLPFPLDNGTLCSASVVVSRRAPVRLLLP